MTVRSRPRVVRYCSLLALFALGGCAQELATGPESADVRAAKGGNGKGGGGGSGGGGGDDGGIGDPTVDRTDPTSAPQGTTLDVAVFGTNYEPGSDVTILLDLKSTRDARTNSTTFVSDTELIANITIDDDAEIDFYDVQVTTPRGKKGVGIELLEITGPTADLARCTLDASGGCQSGTTEGLYADGQGFYVGWFNANTKSKDEANFNVNAPCEDGRSMNIVLPSSWLALGSPSLCNAGPGSGATGRAHFHVPELLQADGSCAGGEPCPIGSSEPGATPTGVSGSPTLRHHFWFDTDGDGAFDDLPANAVWTDGAYTVERRGSDGATACEWRVTGATADLWVDGQQQGSVGQGLALDVVIARYDGVCGF